jgi:hypothetical protein
VAFESGVGGLSVPRAIAGGDVLGVRYSAEGRNSRWVLELDRNPWTLVVIIHEEAINQFPRMAYFGGVFSCREVNVRAVDYIPEHPYPVQAIINVFGQWKLRDLFRLLVIHLLLSCLGQCFGQEY